ncbi:MAG: dockerin type I domain-containing protein, partial [Acutalibacteraceae bacterium]|nr:dockerin type I domain-containing protein [Acutalibacteraceae bacterium]
IICALALITASAAETKHGYVTGTDVRVRENAGTEYKELGRLSNTEVLILGSKQSSKGETWYQIRTLDGRLTGYMHGDYIGINSNTLGILKGDTNGDYDINQTDIDNVNKHISGTQKLSGAAFNSADVNGDNKIDATDAALIKDHIDGKKDISLLAFPDSYKTLLTAVKQVYPNYIFVADYIDLSFSEVVYNQTLKHRKLVSMTGDGVSWRALGPENYNWQTGEWNKYSGNWTDASKEVIAYYVDPRNFLNVTNIYAFVTQAYNTKQNEEMLSKIIKDSYLEKGFSDSTAYKYGDINSDGVINTADLAAVRLHLLDIKTLSSSETTRADINADEKINTADLAAVRLHMLGIKTLSKTLEYDGSYVKIIMEAAKQSGVSPYVLASTLILEQGRDGKSDLISGKYGYYNFFNFSASGADVVGNGIAYAKSQGWSTRSASIIGGAKKYAEGYIAAGQNTYYYKDFDVQDTNPYTHQYAQSIYDAISSSALLRTAYIGQSNEAAVFRIPVYKDMPPAAAVRPEENNKLNNYYFSNISVSGLSPTFSMYTQKYTLSVAGNTTVYVTTPKGAVYTGEQQITLKQGTNTVVLPVKSETGFINNYTLTVTASAACVLTVSTS